MTEIKRYTSAAKKEIAIISEIKQIFSTTKISIDPRISYQRSSSPQPKIWEPSTSSRSKTLDTVAYKRFVFSLEQPPKRILVRGVEIPPKGIISGHLVPFNVQNSIKGQEEVLDCPVAEGNVSFSTKFRPLFFKRSYKTLFRNISKLCAKDKKPCKCVQMTRDFLCGQEMNNSYLVDKYACKCK